jgi:F-box protein 18 (helicase)
LLVYAVAFGPRAGSSHIIQALVQGDVGGIADDSAFLYLLLTVMAKACPATQTYEDCLISVKIAAGVRSASKSVSSKGIAFSSEQMAILQTDLCAGDVLKIVAFAGTGKTTTLLHYARLHPSLSILYLAFNTTVCDHAAKLFPPNCKAVNMHKLAFSKVGWRYPKVVSELSVATVATLLGRWRGSKKEDRIDALRCIAAVDSFCMSSAPDFDVVHVTLGSETSTAAEIVDLSRRCWMNMQGTFDQKHESQLPMTHNGYLKLYALSNPCLSQKYDCVMLDEAQDASPVFLQVVLSQQCSKIVIGDPHQSIYAFAGAKNSMSSVESTRTLWLSRVFRFGGAIAHCANMINRLKVPSNAFNHNLLLGVGPDGSVLDGRGDRKMPETVAYIARSNATVLQRATSCVREGCTKIHFVGGWDSYPFTQLVDMFFVVTGRFFLVQTPLISSFKSLDSLTAFCAANKDSDLAQQLKAATSYANSGCNLPEIVRGIRRCAVGEEGLADAVISTVHKAKGLEFGSVFLENDFIETVETDLPAFTPARRGSADDREQEYNSLYVAATRAKTTLYLNADLSLLFQQNGLRPVIIPDTFDDQCACSSAADSNADACRPNIAMASVISSCPKRRVCLRCTPQHTLALVSCLSAPGK